MAVRTIVEYVDPLQHIFNPSDVEVVNGRATLASKALPSELAFFNFDVDGSAVSKRGNLTISLPDYNAANPSSAVVQNGWLEMKGNDFTYGHLTAIPKVVGSLGDNAAFRAKVRVNFTTIGPNLRFFELKSGSSSASVLAFFQNQGGGVTRIRTLVYDDTGAIIKDSILGFKTFAVGDIFEVGFSRDASSGDYYFMLDGAKTNIGPMTFTMDTIDVDLGGPYSLRTNWSYDDIQLWNGLERPDLVREGISPEDTTYSTGIGNFLVTTAPFLMDKFIDFAEAASRDNGTDIKYLFLVNTDMYWFDGVAWVLSNGSILEANTVAEIVDNIASFPVTEGVGAYITLQALLKSTTGYHTPILESNDIVYSFYFQNGGVSRCIVYGNVVNNCGDPVAGAKIKVDSDDYLNGNDLVGPACITTTNANGRWSMGMVETETSGKTVTITISYPSTEGDFDEEVVYENVIIPNSPTKRLDEIV